MNKKLLKKIKTSFIEKFNANPLMIFSPGRVNLIGEHTDYNDGFVFPAAVDMGIILAIQKSNANISTAYAIDKDEEHIISTANLKPLKKGSWANYIIGVVAEIQNCGKTVKNFDLVFGGDIPGGAGMSSSAALENSVVFGLNVLFDLGLSKKEMILISQKAEHNFVGVKCGIMDQYASMFGIENNALLLDCRTIKSKAYKIDFQDYQLIFINSNVKHSLTDSAYNDRRSVCETISKKLKVKALRDVTKNDLKKIQERVTPENYQKALYIIEENERVLRAAKAVAERDLKLLGKLLFQSHNGLQNQYKVSCDEIDFLVSKARANEHVLGARMMGGGFGGCTINLILTKHTKSFTTEVSKCYKEKFNIDCTVHAIRLSDGTKIIE